MKTKTTAAYYFDPRQQFLREEKLDTKNFELYRGSGLVAEALTQQNGVVSLD